MKTKLLILLLFISPAQAEWWTEDKTANGLTIAANVLLIADWAQTREIADNPDYYESGLAGYFITEHPRTRDVNIYFASALVIYNTLNYFLPNRYKKISSSFVIGFELKAVARNIEVGVGMKF